MGSCIRSAQKLAAWRTIYGVTCVLSPALRCTLRNTLKYRCNAYGWGCIAHGYGCIAHGHGRAGQRNHGQRATR